MLTASGHKVKGVEVVNLSWTGTNAASMDIYQNGSVIATVPNSGAYTDNTGRKGHGSFTYKVCEAGTLNCSNDAAVQF